MISENDVSSNPETVVGDQQNRKRRRKEENKKERERQTSLGTAIELKPNPTIIFADFTNLALKLCKIEFEDFRY